MSSIIALNVGTLELDWGQNNIFTNHSKLFLPKDIKAIPYYYANAQVEYQEGYSRKLRDVKKRLELLGYSISHVKEIYQTNIAAILEDGVLECPDISFEAFTSAILSTNLRGEGLPPDIHNLVKNLHPYITLRLLIENPENLDLELTWGYSDIVDGGWVLKDQLYESVSNAEKFLIVTEGSSDLFIIKRAFEILSPDISDFFN